LYLLANNDLERLKSSLESPVKFFGFIEGAALARIVVKLLTGFAITTVLPGNMFSKNNERY